MLEVLYQDEHYIAVNKPHNLLVHRTKISEEKEEFAVQILREQIGTWVSPCHRLDRKTSGVLVFGLHKEAVAALSASFANQQVRKEYITLVRGFLPENGSVNKALPKENGTLQEARTDFERLECFELPFEVSRYPYSRYSLARITPFTGRMHQIRRHMAHLRHYVIGDKVHGECKHNKAFEQRYGLNTMLLHAQFLQFVHFEKGEVVSLRAGMQPQFSSLLAEIRKENIYHS